MASVETISPAGGGAYPEKATAVLAGTIENESGVATQPTTLTMTLYNTHDGAIINSQNATDIIGSVTAGVISHLLTADDMAIQDAARLDEWHSLLLEWTWAGGRASKKLLRFRVRNLLKVT